MSKFTIKHKTLPCHFTWDGNDEEWESIKDYLSSELKNNGIENFIGYENIIREKTKLPQEDIGYEEITQTKKVGFEEFEEEQNKTIKTSKKTRTNTKKSKNNSSRNVKVKRGSSRSLQKRGRGTPKRSTKSIKGKKRIVPRKPKLKRNN